MAKLQLMLAALGRSETVRDPLLTFAHGLLNRRPDELHGEQYEHRKGDHLSDQRCVNAHGLLSDNCRLAGFRGSR